MNWGSIYGSCLLPVSCWRYMSFLISYFSKNGFFSDIGFVMYSQKDCNKIHSIHYMGDDAANDHEACKIWCVNSAICGGFVVGRGGCYFKDTTCGNNVVNKDEADTYVKEIKLKH